MTKPRKSGSNGAAVAAVCPKCDGYGYVIGDDKVARPCDCRLTDKGMLRKRLAAAGIPKGFADKNFKNFIVTHGDHELQDVLDSAQAYAGGFSASAGEGLMLRGCPGSGKTHIAVATLNEVMKRGFTGYYANFTDLLFKIRESFSENAIFSESDLMSILDDADLVIIDDVGDESISEWVRERLYLIINRRYENARATIMTTNCSEEELRARVGERTASRLYEMCSMDFPLFPKRDYRRANLK